MALTDREKELAAMTPQERYRARLQDANDQRHAQEQRAHECFMDRRRDFIEANPNAVSPWERKAVLEEHNALQQRKGLQAHELAMLGKQGENAIALENAKGANAQGVAKINADASITNAEREWATRDDMNARDNTTRENIARTEQAGLTERNKISNETQLALEDKKGANALDAIEAQGKNALDLEREKGSNQAAQTRLGQEGAERIASIQAGQEQAKAAMDAAAAREKRIDDMVKTLMEHDTYKNLPADEVRAEAMRRLGLKDLEKWRR